MISFLMNFIAHGDDLSQSTDRKAAVTGFSATQITEAIGRPLKFVISLLFTVTFYFIINVVK